MFRNHLKIGYRNLWKYKAGTAINISGLALGMAAFILIALYIKEELSYDRHHEHADETYRVTVKNFDPDGSMNRHWAFASAGHAARLKSDYTVVTHAARFYAWAFPDLYYGDEKLPFQQVVFADPDVFEIFTFPFLLGDKSDAFDDPFSLVLTESTAVRIFGNDWKAKGILGETVTLSRDGREAPYKVTGVMQDMPEQQHFHFEYLAPMKLIETVMGEDEMNNVGGNYNWLTYVRIAPGTDIEQLEVEADAFFDKYMGKFGSKDASDFYAFDFQPLKDIHLRSNLEGEIETNGSIQQIYIFGIVGALLLLVACVNYMNLATSHYSRRMKEVGVRKVVGAGRSTLLSQFLTESFLITLLAIPVTMVLVVFGLPYINGFMDKDLAFDIFRNVELLGMVFAIALFVSLVAGAYPAIFLTRINLLKSLKGESAMRASKWGFRSWLVTFQYAVAIALIFSILVIENQLNYIHQSDSGYERDRIVNVGLSRNIRNTEVFKRELQALPDVASVAYSSRIPTGRLLDNQGSSFYQGDSLVPTQFRFPYISVDEDFIDTYGLKLIAGEGFARAQDMMTDSIGHYIINRKAAELFGFQNPADIIGQKLSYGDFDGSTFKIGSIQGVVEDFHFESMHTKIVPMVMLKTDQYAQEISIKLRAQNIPAALQSIEEVYAQFDPASSPEFHFLDDLFDRQYEKEQRLGTMVRVFAMIAIFIGCLGLLGMVGFIIETKTKEIGIRKVLGASVQNILLIISKHFFILIAIAFAVALPISYWLMKDWLDTFVYRTGISLLNILLPLALTLAFTIATLAYQSIRASLANPVDSLKDE